MSQRLKIEDEVLRWDIDNATSLRLAIYDNEKDEANREFWMKLVGGTGEGTEDDAPVDKPVVW